MVSLSITHEDYLEAMVMLGATETASVRAVDVAEKMGVSKASVNKAVGVLKEKGLVIQPYYGDITLTKEGVKYGNKVFDRHRVLTDFLSNAVGIDPAIAEEEACKMEHAISDESFRKWIAFIKSLD